MAGPRFNLKNPQRKNGKLIPKNQQGRTQVVFIQNVGNVQVRKCIGVSLFPYQWDFKRQEPHDSEYEYYDEYLADKEIIYKWRDEASKLRAELRLEGNLFPDVFKGKLLERMNPQGQNKSRGERVSLVDYAEEQRKKAKSKDVRYIIRQVILSLNAFCDYANTPSLYTYSFNRNLFRDYIDFLENVRENGANTINKWVKKLKWILKEAKFDGHKVSDFLERKEFHYSPITPNKISLSKDELQAIAGVELSCPKMRLARDWFLLGCYTGARFSDWPKIIPENVNRQDDKAVLVYVTKKTNEKCACPVWDSIKEVWSRYPNGMEVPKYTQKINPDIKEVARMAGLDYRCVFTAGKKTINEPKYNLVTTHTARRTCVTILNEEGLAEDRIMAITGHTDSKTLKNYVKTTPEKSALLVLNEIGDAGIL